MGAHAVAELEAQIDGLYDELHTAGDVIATYRSALERIVLLGGTHGAIALDALHATPLDC
ncbi:hypothetical protein [Candidatus Solirubrobacter pratensis]|uniref:hypothetical protein n=1 Tax=Candidatus Solirubrobacter pratensis TaxID=1298857 RepID=UPI0003F944DF|nr:hypothetical protein [Candidatus Solirubrobacter pratensis]